MNFKTYSEIANKTIPEMTVQDKIHNANYGMIGEVGEVVDTVKKSFYQGHFFNIDKILEELGDVLWYINMMADTLGSSLENVARMNNEKLLERYPEGFDAEKSINREA